MAETDTSLPPARRHEIEDLLAKKKATYQINLYAGVSHGFGVRVDLESQVQVFAKEAAFYQALLWFNEWLKGRTYATATSTKYVANGLWNSLETEGVRNDQRVQHDFEYSTN